MKLHKSIYLLFLIVACASSEKVKDTEVYNYDDNVNYDSKRINILYSIHKIKLDAFCRCIEDVKGRDSLKSFYKNDKSRFNSEPGIEGFGFYSRERGIINGTRPKAINTLYLVDSLVQKESKNIINRMYKDQHTYNEGQLVNASISQCYSLSNSRVVDSIIRTNMINNDLYISKHNDGIKYSKDQRLHDFMSQVLDIDTVLPDYYSFSKYMDKKYNE